MQKSRKSLIVISAGVDAHMQCRMRRNGGGQLSEDDYAWATEQLMAIARTSKGCKIIAVLEGGSEQTRIEEHHVLRSFAKSSRE